jgi:HEAT repeat protein
MSAGLELPTASTQRSRRRRAVRGWSVVGLAAAGLLLFALAYPTGPRYEGRHLRHWLVLAASEGHQDRLRAEAVLRTVGPEAVPELVRALEGGGSRLGRAWRWLRGRVFRARPEASPSSPVSQIAAERLGHLGAAASNAVPALLRWEARFPEQGAALPSSPVQAIGLPATPHLLAALADPDARLRAVATSALTSPSFQPAADDLLPAVVALLQDADAGARLRAVRALPVLAPARPDVAAALAALLPGADGQTVHEVIESLREYGPVAVGSADQVRPWLRAPLPKARLEAAQALRAICPPAREVVPVLVDLLEHPDTQWMAAYALAEMGADAVDAIPMLLKLLETAPTHRPSRTPSYASVTLSRLGPGSVPGLVPLLSHSSSDVRVNAATALAGLGDAAASAVPGLTRMLGAADLEEQMAAATTLGRLGPVARAAVPGLTRLANLETTQDVIVGHVRSAARVALEQVRVSPPGR